MGATFGDRALQQLRQMRRDIERIKNRDPQPMRRRFFGADASAPCPERNEKIQLTVLGQPTSGTLTMTHHATNLLLPDGANITFTNGDAPEFVKMHDTNSEWKMVGGQKVLGGMWSDGYTSAVVVFGSAVSLTTNTQANVTSLSLGPGDWDVSGVISFKGGATTVLSYLIGSLSSTSATLDQTAHRYSILSPRSDSFNQASEASYAIGPSRFSLTATTTVYLVAMAGFTTSTCLAYGGINARRIK